MANNTNLSFPSAFCQQFFKDGKPLSSGKLYTYIAGSSTAVVTYKTISGGTESANMNTNPIILDMSGKANLVISKDTAYKFVLFDRNDVKVDEWDNVTAGGSDGSGSSNVYVEGTSGEIDVEEESVGHIRRFIVSLSDSVKNAISNLSSSVNDIIDALYNKKDKQQPVSALGSTTKVPVSFTQNANGELDIEFDDITFPDWTSAINAAVADCEKTENKKTSVTGNESSNTYYPTIKALVDYLDGRLQNLGGKLITDNGNPFSDYNDLPSTTPYQGVTISDKDYAYVQGTGFAERWSASVSGSNVTWVQEYSINIPVFTPAQQAAIDSNATATKIGNYDSHIANTTIHVTATDKNNWNAKQNAISDLAEIRSGAAAGATALQPNGNGSNVTSTFTAASSRTNISSGEKLSTIFGKIAKWFSDLKALAFKDNVSNSDISGTIADAHIASASTWNSKQNALPTSGTPSSTFAINVSGSAYTLPYGRASWNGPSQKGDKKVVCINPTELDYNDAMVTLDIYESVASVGDMFRGKLMVDLRRNLSPAYVYNASYVGKILRYTTMYVKYDPNTHNVYVVFNKNNDNYVGIKAVVASAQGYQGVSAMSNVTLYNNPDVETTTQYTNISITYNYICMVQSQVGSTRLPIFANADGSLSTMNVDEYYCWAQPTSQWTDVMEIDLYNVQNQCNNEILGSVRNINLTSSHPSLCYLRVNLPELQGAGRYRFTLEFEITNSSGILVDDAYGVLILVPPTGYSGEAFLAECVYDSSGKPQSSVMNQFHIPQQGQTTRHKLYVDGHTYRVVKTK